MSVCFSVRVSKNNRHTEHQMIKQTTQRHFTCLCADAVMAANM